MPLYNAEGYVAEAVESILGQTYREFELIIIDDGSTDGSSVIVDRYASKDARIRVQRTANDGVVAARNLGLEMATGELMAVMDSDDRADPRRLEMQQNYLERHPEVVAVGSCATMMDEEGDVLGQVSVPLNHAEIEAMHLRGVDSIFNSSAMLRTEAARQVGGYRPGIMPGEDYDLWLRLGEVGWLANMPDALLFWRRCAGGLSACHQHGNRAMIERILADAWRRRGLSGAPPRIPACARTRADLYRQLAWTALRSGMKRVARKHAVNALRIDPWNLGSWRLACCAARGY